MGRTVSIEAPMNRVEGDLEVVADVRDGQVVEARCRGTMYRGFERILEGRGALDGLVITPRICGICSTGHLLAAARALDQVAGVEPPPDAVLIRNVSALAELLQSDLRQAVLMFAADLVSERYQGRSFYAEAVRRYRPLAGASAIEVIRETKRVLEIVAILGGQWPHSSFMVPGGVASLPTAGNLVQCRLILASFRDWYERRILGGPLTEWATVRSVADLDAWLDAHADGELGFLMRCARELGFDQLGRGVDAWLSYGALDIPPGSAVRGLGGSQTLIPAGVRVGGRVEPFDEQRVTEHIDHSWFEGYEGGRHPSRGITRPYASGGEAHRYSWAKAPRYDGRACETGPLAERLVARDPLFVELTAAGASVTARLLARVTRAAWLMDGLSTWLGETRTDQPFYRPPGEISDGVGVGLTHAARGALGHWVRVVDGRIAHYQIITPTAWHASPRDGTGARGPIEEALVGTPVADPDDPIELGHVVRSFDPCLVCTVHAVRGGQPAGRVRVGGTSG